MQYNTTEERLKLPQYGRAVQTMVERAVAMPTKPMRQAYAERTVRVMRLLNPQVESRPDYLQILWNHLAFMADYKLDIDYPCEIEEHKVGVHPSKLSYPGHRIRYRHYGHLVEQALTNLREMPADAPERRSLTQLIALRMKRYLADWKGDGIENDKVARDIEQYTDGKVSVEEAIEALETVEERAHMKAMSSATLSRWSHHFPR